MEEALEASIFKLVPSMKVVMKGQNVSSYHSVESLPKMSVHITIGHLSIFQVFRTSRWAWMRNLAACMYISVQR